MSLTSESPLRRLRPAWLWLIPLCLTLFTSLSVQDPGATKPQSPQRARAEATLQEPDTAPFPRKGNYKGSAACIDCHEDEAESIAESPHQDIVEHSALMGCETCHGPGSWHSDDSENNPKRITLPSVLSPRGQERLCGRCHRPELKNHGGDPAGFTTAGKGCTDCHGVHDGVRPENTPALHFGTKAATDAAADAVGADACTKCHPGRDDALKRSAHRGLQSKLKQSGCESCHGEGSLHETHQLGRLITRPDQARDGIQTCRSCHEKVDPVRFHWRDKKNPLLSQDLNCVSCHRVHDHGRGLELKAATASKIDAQSGELIRPARTKPLTNQLCATCHAPAFKILKGTVHESLGKPDTLLSQGCGSCHEGGEAHARSGGKKDRIESMHASKADLQKKVCMQCHQRDTALRHHAVGSHQRREVSCLSCHSPAAKKGKTREDAERNCASCHSIEAAEFKLPNHHPVDGKRMFCSDCHEPHSARPRLRNLDLKRDRCVSCHREYRGPFVFAHQASRSDGCTACHSPHGSTNKRLLKQINTQQNCLQCHADYPSFHDQTSGSVFTNCLNCHTRVHGSNHSRYLLR